MIKNLIKLAEHLDRKGLHKEADYVDWIIKSSSAKIDLSAKEDLKEHLVSEMGVGEGIVMPGKRKAAKENAKATISISAKEKDIMGMRHLECEIKSSNDDIHNALYSVLVANLFKDDEGKRLIKKCFGLEKDGQPEGDNDKVIQFEVDDDNNRYYYSALMSNV